MTKYVCPITLQYFRNPVIGSDGHIYEKNAIDQWVKKYARSPITQRPFNALTYPCLYLREELEILELSEPFFYMKRYQYNIKEWLIDHVEKYNIELTYTQRNILDDSDDLNLDCSQILDLINQILDQINQIHRIIYHDINSCKMPDRILLYDFLDKSVDEFNYRSKDDVIKITSPDDHGLKYYFQKIMCRDNIDSEIFDSMDPVIHFKLLDYSGFKHYVKNFETLEHFDNFIINDLDFFNSDYHPYLLHCFLSNHKLFNESMDHNKYMNTLKKIIDSEFLIIKFDNDPSGQSITESLSQCNDKIIPIAEIINHLITNQDFVKNLCKEDMLLICKHINNHNAIKSLLKESELHHNEGSLPGGIKFMFTYLDQFSFQADVLIDWLKYHDIDLNTLYHGRSVFSHYLNNLNYIDSEMCPSVCENIGHMIKHNIYTSTHDLKILANILILHKKKITDDFLLNIYEYVRKCHLTTDSEYIVCCIVRLKKHFVDHKFLCDLIENYSITKKHSFCINGVKMFADYSMIQGILVNPLINEHMINLIVKKYHGFENEWLEHLLKNPMITEQMLEILPDHTKITDKILKIAANNQTVSLKMLRNLICRK